MTPAEIRTLFTLVPVLYWPVLVCEIIRIIPEIRQALAEGRKGWICFDLRGRLFLDLYPEEPAGWQDALAALRAPDWRRRIDLLGEAVPGLPARRPAHPAWLAAIPRHDRPDGVVRPTIADTS